MGLLDNLNPLSTVVKDFAETALAPEMKLVSDGLNAGVDLAKGNSTKLSQDLKDCLQDAVQDAGDHPRKPPVSHPWGASEPTAPPLRAALSGTSRSGPQASRSSPGPSWSAHPAANSPAAQMASSPPGTVPATGALPAMPVAVPSWATASPVAALPGTATAGSLPTGTIATAGTTSAAVAGSPTTSSTAVGAATNAFFNQSDTDLMNAVRNGQIPDSVKNDPAQMQQLQLRMNDISEMNQLISQMMAAMHDMNKAVIQNIRA